MMNVIIFTLIPEDLQGDLHPTVKPIIIMLDGV